MYGTTRTTPYFSMEQHGQDHTYVWSNTDNTILLYGATRTTPYLCMEQHGQHHTYVWSNTSNTILLYDYTGATRATPYLYITTRATPYISIATQVLHCHSLRLYAIGQKYFPTHHPSQYNNYGKTFPPAIQGLQSIRPQSDNNNCTN